MKQIFRVVLRDVGNASCAINSTGSVPCKAPCDRRILAWLVRVVINRTFASENCASATKEFEWRRRRPEGRKAEQPWGDWLLYYIFIFITYLFYIREKFYNYLSNYFLTWLQISRVIFWSYYDLNKMFIILFPNCFQLLFVKRSLWVTRIMKKLRYYLRLIKLHVS